ncbi:glutathione S-transferase [Truncatella angustata]|uniref:Glutathione S-transferase n=1 Tax=Truncatella angustata TaxID=152316 RepID=A0A9P9A2S0_9PEZI|nr:glutathione S-transferase [Truncatella angustata]KAH6658506.1 glutathione S-transferase [Truncatella angustata]
MGPHTEKPVHAGPQDSWHGVVGPESRFTPEAGRYHLYIGLFCPFAHRANLVRHLKGLQDAIPISVVKPYPKGDDKGWPGWQFPGAQGPNDVYEGATEDKLFGSGYLHEVYFKADKDYKGRYSVPLLWDTKEHTIVNNESAELLRWMQTGFDELLPEGSAGRTLTLYPEPLRSKIDEVGEWMQRDLNSGVYKAGFATDQETYDENVPVVFAALNKLERIIHENGGPYVLGTELTELDIRAYATVIRFDTVYVQHFKCDLGTIRGNYPVIHEWLKNLYWNVKGFKETTDFKHIKENYTKSHDKINPLAITPMGPYPNVEERVSLDFNSLKPGSIKHPAVLAKEKELYGQ